MLCHNLNFVWLNLRLGGCYLSQDSAFFQWPMAIGQKLDPLSQALIPVSLSNALASLKCWQKHSVFPKLVSFLSVLVIVLFSFSPLTGASLIFPYLRSKSPSCLHPSSPLLVSTSLLCTSKVSIQ